jgi:hypothetical protein
MEPDAANLIRKNILRNIKNTKLLPFYVSVSSIAAEKDTCPYLLACKPQNWQLPDCERSDVYEVRSCFNKRLIVDESSGLLDSMEMLGVAL